MGSAGEIKVFDAVNRPLAEAHFLQKVYKLSSKEGKVSVFGYFAVRKPW